MTHIPLNKTLATPTGHIDLNSDGIGYVESYDFSTANTSKESRIFAITQVASVCYQNPKALGSISLYDRLSNESGGLPSSSFEFVPVLLDMRDSKFRPWADKLSLVSPVFKYGEIVHGGYLLTNLRALIDTVGEDADNPVFFNDETECGIISCYFKVFKSHIDLATRAQAVRHRASWQELSRRYVSGKKLPFEFYTHPKLRDLEANHRFTNSENHTFSLNLTTEHLIEASLTHYDAAIASGVKPEVARRLLPQSMYTTIWSAWQPKQLENFYKLRLDSHAQAEINELANAMNSL